jgi:parallel beta-helix repeat protein
MTALEGLIRQVTDSIQQLGGIGMAGSGPHKCENGLVCADGDYAKVQVPRRPHKEFTRMALVVAIALTVTLAPAMMILHTVMTPMKSSVSVYIPHAPVRIDDNADFQATASSEGWPGSGTLASPYIISGYEFLGAEGSSAFYVGNSTTYFVLRQCYFHDAAWAVYLLSSSNAKVENCSMEKCNLGLYLYIASATIANNSITQTTFAAFDILSAGTTYSANNISGNTYGLYLGNSDGNVVSGNTFQNNFLGGLILDESPLTLLRNNVFLKDGLTIDGRVVAAWNTHDIDTSNTVNGQPVLYLVDDVASTVSTDYGQVILANCTNTIVQSQVLENTTTGVLAGFCNGISVMTSTLMDNYYGMRMSNCDNSSLMSTHTINNTVGIEIVDSFFCYPAGVTFQGDSTGVSIRNAPNTTVIGNIIESDRIAVLISSSTGARLLSNTISASGIFIEGSLLEHWNTHSIDDTNTVNGYPIVYLKNLVGEPVPAGAGQVILANCAQMQVAFSYIDRATAAFQLGFTQGCRVTTLSASHCEYGVRLYQCAGIQVDNAMLNDNTMGTQVESSDTCLITTNWMTNCTYAIVLMDSTHQTLDHNVMTNCGISIGSGNLEGWNTHIIDRSNFVNGIPVYYQKDSSGLSVIDAYGQIILANCTSSIVGPRTIVNATIALQLGFCSDITVNYLSASENLYGVMMEHSNGCILKGPWLVQNSYGVFMEGGLSNIIADGLFYMNEFYAVYLSAGTSGNLVAGNTFQYNNGAGEVYDAAHAQAADWGSGNAWNTSIGGNYWQEWLTPDGDGNGIVDVPYKMAGYREANDFLPLTTPTQIIPEFGVMPFAVIVLLVAIVLTIRARGRKE